MTYYTETFRTSFGNFSTAVDEAGSLIATAFGGRTELIDRLPPCDLKSDTFAGRRVREQVLAYCAGELRQFTLALASHGTAFQRRVWEALAAIPFGETRTYGGVAALLGNSSASRAVGRANATNPICLIVPCHRVIGANGSLTGFAFGEETKRRLLDHETRIARRTSETRAA